MKKTCFNKGISVACVFLFFWLGSHPQDFVSPVCYGGSRLLKEFLQEEMIYPESALKDGTEGTVELAFIIHPDGSVDELTLTASVSPEIDAEAMRLFRYILWKPALDYGKPVSFRQTLSIRFKIKPYLRQHKSRDNLFFQLPYKPVDESYKIFDLKMTDRLPRPIFSGVDRNLNNFLAKNLVYPEAAYKQNISGTVKLLFVVEVTGRISNIEVIESVGGGCSEESIRVAKMINWHPGIKNNLAVRTFMPLEITFDISGKKMGGAIPTPGQVQ